MHSRRNLLAMAVGVVLVATVIAGWVVFRALPPRAERVNVGVLAGGAPVLLVHEGRSSGSLTFPLVALPHRSGIVGVTVANGVVAPSATVRVELLGEGGKPVAACTVSPSSYSDGGIIGCQVRDASSLRRVRLTATNALHPLGVYVATIGGKPAAGAFAIDRHRPGLGARLRELRARIVAVRRASWSVPVGALALIAGIATTMAVLLGVVALAVRDLRHGARS